MAADTSTEQLLEKIDELNTNPAVHGILLQHPVPEQIDERACFDAIDIRNGKHAVVVGRSPILGKPMAMMLLNANATVTICHSRTENLKAHIAQADIVVGAVGKPEFIKADWIKQGAVVVDAGYHPGGLGDIELGPLANKASAITPVPGGVGPMTINTLIYQCVMSGEKHTD